MNANLKPTLAALFVMHLKDAIRARDYPFPVSVKWVFRSTEEIEERSQRPFLQEVVKATLSGDDRYDDDVHRLTVLDMAVEFSRAVTCWKESRFEFGSEASWFEIIDDPLTQTVDLRIVSRYSAVDEDT